MDYPSWHHMRGSAFASGGFHRAVAAACGEGHLTSEILRGKTSRRAWEIESILLARTRLSPPLHLSLALKRAAETEPKQEPGTHAPRHGAWRKLPRTARAFLRVPFARPLSVFKAHSGSLSSVQEHRSTGARERVLGFAGTSSGNPAWKRVDGQPMANSLVDSMGLLLMPMIPTVHVSKLSFKAHSGSLSSMQEHRSTGASSRLGCQ